MESAPRSSVPPKAEPSPEGRRILIAVVTGEIGDRIQSWRVRHDPVQAHRLPPHTTLCYWAPDVDPNVLERQVRHGFDRPVSVRLGGVREFDNGDRTFYVSVHETEALDAARTRLYDGTHLTLPGTPDWTWHVTCVRYGIRQNLDRVRELVSHLSFDATWHIDTLAYLQLQDGTYRSIAEWRV